MLPFGHVAAGYLVAQKIAQSSHIPLSEGQYTLIIAFGLFWSFAPDLDMFFSFFRSHSFTLAKDQPSHRNYISHAPFLWVAIGALIWPFMDTDMERLLFIASFFGAMSHFVLDSIQVGVMWAWPISHKKYALLPGEMKMKKVPTKFWKFWIEFLRSYATTGTVTFVAEIGVILLALYVLVF